MYMNVLSCLSCICMYETGMYVCIFVPLMCMYGHAGVRIYTYTIISMHVWNFCVLLQHIEDSVPARNLCIYAICLYAYMLIAYMFIC